jgi:hypothetical protein
LEPEGNEEQQSTVSRVNSLAGARCRKRVATFEVSDLNGTWLKTSGELMPEEITLRIRSGQFTVKWWDAGGVSCTTFMLDGKEHAIPTWFGTENYRAEYKDGTIVVTKHAKSTVEPTGELTHEERWSTRDGARRLIFSSAGKESTFQRPPFLRSLFVASP